ncbi:MAG: 2-amino-4-hydroxy-6-hydroxymethyldihydropteridine diphosphokinase [Verrucomicrobiota bacterium]
MRAGVALGSNLGDRLFHLMASRKAILQLAGVLPPILSSAVYETQPVDCEPGAGPFLNAVLEFSHNGAPMELFKMLKQLEVALGRPRHHAHNVSRAIDLDLLYFGETRLQSEELSLPHPRMHRRQFVLQPLAEIRPELVLPGQATTVRELLASLDQSTKVSRLTSEW